MIRRTRFAIAAAALLCIAASGCFQYIPVSMDAVPAGEDVRVYVSRRGMADVPEELPTGGSFVTGRLGRGLGDSVMIQVPVVRRIEDPSAPDIRQNIFLPRSEVLEVRRRRFSPTRTALAIGGAAGLGAGIVVVVIQASGSDTGGPGEGPDQIRLPLGYAGNP